MKKIECDVLILGGGVSGLAAALTLAEKGKKVILLEKSDQIGGAARSIKVSQGRYIPAGYHQIVGSDKPLIKMLEKLGVIDQVQWKNTSISVLVDGKNTNLASPKDILFLKDLPFISRVRYLFFGVRCLLTRNWKKWQDKSVTDFIKSWADVEILEKIFKPLVDIKFGFSTDEADAAWLGLRLSKGEGNVPFGYIPNTSWTKVMCDKFEEKITDLGGKIITGKSLKKIEFDNKKNIKTAIISSQEKIIPKVLLSTIPPPAIIDLLKYSKVDKKDIGHLDKIKYISCYSSLIGLPFVPFKDYWTVALKPRKTFGGCFSISLLNDTLITKSDESVVNLFTNVAYGKDVWGIKKYEKLIVEDLESLTGRKIKPNWIKTNIIWFVSPVFNVGYKNPPDKLSQSIYLAGIYKTYPKFSSTGEAIADGVSTAKLILSNKDD